MNLSTKPAQPAPTRHDVLWCSDGGMIACTAHLGYYATTMLAVSPTAERLATPLDVWHIFTNRERDEFENAIGSPAMCETCVAALRR